MRISPIKKAPEATDSRQEERKEETDEEERMEKESA